MMEAVGKQIIPASASRLMAGGFRPSAAGFLRTRRYDLDRWRDERDQTRQLKLWRLRFFPHRSTSLPFP
jgi:hypothetical protein